MNEEEIIKNNAEKTKKEVRWWSYAAWTLPFVALAGIFFFNVLGWDNAFDISLVIGATIMFAISVFWWWWAIYKIYNFADMMSKTAERLKSIKEDFNKLKNNIRR